MATKAPIDKLKIGRKVKAVRNGIDKLKIGRKVKAVRNGIDYGVGKIIEIMERPNGRWYLVRLADKTKPDITVRGPSLTPA